MEPQNGHGFRSIVKVLDASLIRAPQEAQDVESNEDVMEIPNAFLQRPKRGGASFASFAKGMKVRFGQTARIC